MAKALTPASIAAKRDEDFNRDLSEVIASINQELMKDYRQGETFMSQVEIAEKFQQGVINEFRGNGWNIEIKGRRASLQAI